ncbi:Mitogen-activated protein kinase kinase kinase 2 [Desmophyllum pertusum]|uniref:Mitogen-activated protein kinase kinase kinase 2 n=1 Tax=Desmophyllum pertusum TaxID=174260 RepID=A0A9W9ZMK0_9CNID|nr:Mitogen-activated protein kinase kinase kinase 2 [Desmophyllum pertusum]
MFVQYLLYIKEAFQALGVSTAGLYDLTDSIKNDESTSGESAHSWTRGELLGKGGFGKVCKCYRSDTAIVSAVKVAKIVPPYTACPEDQEGSLSYHIKKNKTLSESESGKYTRQILEGVSFLHSEDIIHRDIKGSNVLLDGDGNVKLADFGLSKIIQKIGSKTKLMSYRGTPYWMAPEIIKGEQYGRKADIWSVGCTVVEMLTGSPPWGDLEEVAAIFKIGSEPTEPELPEGVSQDAKEFIQAALTRNPDDRPWSDDLLKHNFVLTADITDDV